MMNSYESFKSDLCGIAAALLSMLLYFIGAGLLIAIIVIPLLFATPTAAIANIATMTIAFFGYGLYIAIRDEQPLHIKVISASFVLCGIFLLFIAFFAT